MVLQELFVESILYAEGHKPPALPIAVMVNLSTQEHPLYHLSLSASQYHQSHLNGRMVHTDYPADSYLCA